LRRGGLIRSQQRRWRLVAVSWTGEAEESGSGAAIGGEDGAPTPGCRSLYSASQMNSLDPF